MVAAGILEIDVDPVGAVLRHRRLQVAAGLVVDRGVHAGLVQQPPAFLVRAGRADDPAALDLGALATERADRARGARHDPGLARFRLAVIEQADIGGSARHADPPDPSTRRPPLRIALRPARAGAAGII